MKKTIYRIYDKPQPSGDYCSKREVEDFEEVAWPETDKPIPKKVQAGIPRFDWKEGCWYDYSVEANRSEMDNLRETVKEYEKTIKTQAEKIKTLETTHETDTNDVQDQIVGLTEILVNTEEA